jgi:selenobiotic family peptide radical SAM maturase
MYENNLVKIYPICCSILGREVWNKVITTLGNDLESQILSRLLALRGDGLGIPSFLSELAYLEEVVGRVSTIKEDIPSKFDALSVNPTLDLSRFSWNLSCFFVEGVELSEVKPQQREEWIKVWRNLRTGEVRVEEAVLQELFVIKMVVEDMSLEEAAEAGNISLEEVESMLAQAVEKGIVFAPPSDIRRNTIDFPLKEKTPDCFVSVNTFTLQWHVTNVCDLNCKHCYDRSKRQALSLDRAIAILDDLRAFCKGKHVKGHVCFTGGNPLLYQGFLKLYRAAAQRGFSLSILGNAAPQEEIQKLCEIKRPGYFQVSLEGLSEYNDKIRGKGHFVRTVKFLRVLGELGVSSSVMLTLTKDNLSQVIPLAQILKEQTDYFTFNRLARVGEGINLDLPGRERYISFLSKYVEVSKNNPIIGFKDNLINVVLHRQGMNLFDGCTGYGCGAAFNFVALLADGAVHACRKFPSYIGNILEQNIVDIYDSEIAQKYRRGSSACKLCELRPACGGCMAVAYSYGLDIFEQRDPHCFI